MVRTRRTGRDEHEIVEERPAGCRNGHPWGRPRSHRARFLPCVCTRGSTGHRIWECASCDDVQCDPPHDWGRPATKGSLYDA